MAKTTLRQLVYKAIKEAIKDDGLTRQELHEYTNYILDHSVLEIKADYLSLKDGNLMGIGEENKDRAFNIPKLLTFSIKKSIAYDFFTNNNSGKTWIMNSYYSFKELEDKLIIDDNVTIIINNYVRHYSDGEWDFDAYRVTYEIEAVEEEKVYRSKRKVEERIKELSKQKADCIFVTTTPDLETYHFVVNKTIYSTIDNKVEGLLNIEWVQYFFKDEDWLF